MLKKMTSIFIVGILAIGLTGCGSFKAKRVSAEESDEKALEITDQWVSKDTDLAIADVLAQMQKHRGFKEYMRSMGTKRPKLFIGEVQNSTSEAYFPIDDFNEAFLNELSMSGDYILVDAQAREKILKEITYQNDGMVDPSQAKMIGKQSGADLMIFGNIIMKPAARGGKTIKEYSVNLRMTDIEKGVEVLRVRAKINKFSDQKSTGW